MQRKHPLYIIFQWHMHQPFYHDPLTNEYRLPWSRLHTTKDYTDMVWHLERYPEIKSVVNFVPSLIEQIHDYQDFSKVKEKHFNLTKKKAAELTVAEKIFILKEFFSAHFERIISKSKRYSALLEKRGSDSTEHIRERITKFSTQDFRDIQVWFLLAWTGQDLRRDKFVSKLIKKDQKFTEKDKSALLDHHEKAVKNVLDRYKKLQNSGQIELTTSPYAHPILPLLIDSDVARISMPNVNLPDSRVRHPEEALRQVKKALKSFKKEFGFTPSGMWPSEGSVSEATADLLTQAGIQRITTDSNVLARSLSRSRNPSGLSPMQKYRPYINHTHHGPLTVYFRDQELSDLIGFRYAAMDAKEAVRDFFQYLEHVNNSLPDDGYPYVAVITMDGENAWEYYEDNGQPFFDELYRNLTEKEWLETRTFEDYSKEYPPEAELQWLHPGSWINADYHIWIGLAEKNLAWDWLNDAINLIAQKKNRGEKIPKSVKNLLLQAEGSDWFWWYGDINNSAHDEIFDSIFCNTLRKIYDLLDEEQPAYLEKNVLETIRER
jgi:alpha-amylase/alpha-mannosidase (GH57 family)